jgi:hypothetical protein
MFVMAKLFIALGFRRDLAIIIQEPPQKTLHGSLLGSEKLQGEPNLHP